MAKVYYDETSNIGRLAFLNIFAPKKWETRDGYEEKYQAVLIFDTEAELVNLSKKAQECVAAEYGNNPLPPNFRWPFARGESFVNPDGEVYDGFAGKSCIKSTSLYQPTIVDEYGNPIPSIRAGDFVSGDYGRCIFNFQCYDHAGNRGVTAYIRTVQRSHKGEPMAEGEGGGGPALPALKQPQPGQAAPGQLPGMGAVPNIPGASPEAAGSGPIFPGSGGGQGVGYDPNDVPF